MIATCISCGYSDIVDLKVGAVHSTRLTRRYTNRQLPDVFICVKCMEEFL